MHVFQDAVSFKVFDVLPLLTENWVVKSDFQLLFKNSL
jgi:hypothetical protein